MRRGSIAICARDSIWNTPIVSAREPAQRLDQLAPETHPRALGIEAGLRDPLLLDQRALPPVQRARDRADPALVETERLADVANRAARPIADHSGRERRSLARILAVDVLDDLLAALMLEIQDR